MRRYGLDPCSSNREAHDSSDASKPAKSGYSNLEAYLNGIGGRS